MLVNQAFSPDNNDETTFLNLDTMNVYPNLLTPPSNENDPVGPTSIFVTSTFSPYDLQQITDNDDGPYLNVVEQPVDRFRFRYKSEMTGTHGSLNGSSSDRTRKQTFPTVELVNFDQPAIIRCSIYQCDARKDNMPHAHRLVKRQGGKEESDDPHDIPVSQSVGYQAVFHSMGIIHTAKKNIIPELTRKKRLLKKEEVARNECRIRELTIKEEIEIKKAAEAESKTINLNIVCLRFDAFIKTDKGILHPICRPLFSHGINNLKSALTGELKIVRMDHVNSPAKGGKEIFILVERVTKKNIAIRFYEIDETDEDNVLWEAWGQFSDLDVHHQYAIVFKTPAYRDLNIVRPVKVYIELQRPSDRARSDPKEFTYIPNPHMYEPGKKRARNSESYEIFEQPPTDLPVTIEDLSLDKMSGDMVTSEDLEAAINNVDSAEFNKVFELYKDEYAGLTTDSKLQKMILRKAKSQEMQKLIKGGTSSPGSDLRKSLLQKNVTFPEESLAKRTCDELRAFMNTKPNSANIVKMLKYWMVQENGTNGLHISIKLGDYANAIYILKVIHFAKTFELVNIKSAEGYTPLHLAIITNDEKIMSQLLFCKARIEDVDPLLNTALHLAVSKNSSAEIMQKLTEAENIKEFIDEENNDGDTALNLAIDANAQELFEILCNRGANVNKRHKKNGYTPLRFAIEKQQAEMVKFLLSHPDIDHLVEDFKKINPVDVARQQDNKEIMKIVEIYLEKNYCNNIEFKIKTESDIELVDEELLVIKDEQISDEELMECYSNVEHFTPGCLSDISKMLDKTGKWQDLAESLELDHLLRTDLCTDSITKFILEQAVEINGESIKRIRNLLADLHEFEAVERLDRMVKTVI